MSQQPPTGIRPGAPERSDRLGSADEMAAEGRTHDAIAAYQQILADDPQDTEVIGRLADMYSRLAASIRRTLGEDSST